MNDYQCGRKQIRSSTSRTDGWMACRKAAIVFFMLVVIVISPGFAQNTAQPSAMDPTAQRLLQQMSVFLKGLVAFGVEVDNQLFIFETGKKDVQYKRRARLYVKRPNQLRADLSGDARFEQIFIDGTTATVYENSNRHIGSISTNGEIAAQVGQATEAFAFIAPSADLIFEDAQETLMDDAVEGRYVGKALNDGIICHHLAFEGIQKSWQIWIEDSQKPFPRRFILTTDQGSQTIRFIARFTEWNPALDFDAGFFNFVKQISETQKPSRTAD